eukprot:TRINITY_DN1451_c0_g1_i6.p1 TRINITY_DN1451_c0_g1~~TRINITY_DN1451_c0_g1_i6.p1  ORF type:complete len:1115 (+),score=282.79 TRINITY_DN1451_c0_g1_i6:76-3420(+)
MAKEMQVCRSSTQDRLTPPEVVANEEVIRKVSSSSLEQNKDISTWTPEAVASRLATNISSGLTTDKAAEVLKRDGLNELYKPPKPTLLMLFLMQMVGFIIILLMIAAVASIVVNATGPNRADGLSYTTGIAIFILVFLNAGIAAWTEYQAGGALDALAKMSQATVDVLRDGKVVTIQTNTVVRGDIVVLGTGDIVPADVFLVEADDFKVSEMCLTGEPDDVAKTSKPKPTKGGEEKLTPPNMAFSGCNVTSGKGKGIVTETGMGTRIGEIAKLMAGEKKGQGKTCCCLPDTSANQTPLQANVQALGARIGLLAIAICVFVFIVGVIAGTIDPNNPKSPSWLYMILIAVTLAVAAIPEGIPLCVTISLSIGCKDMVQKNVLVRKLPAVETLGSASVICSDKTGTLTEGKMTMVQMWSAGIQYDVAGKGFDPTVGKFTRKQGGADANSDVGVRSCLYSALLCCNTTISKVMDPDTQESKWEPKGNSSEAPIIVAAAKVGFTTDAVAKETKRVLEVPFSSSRKMMLTATDLSCTNRKTLCDGGMALPDGSKYLVVCKGAPNILLDVCESCIKANGEVETLTPELKSNILRIVDEYSGQALRVLAVAIRPCKELPYDASDEDLTSDDKFSACRQNLTLVGLVASIDPARDGVKESVTLAHGAGIRVIMITGDYLKTAIAIAKNVNILGSGDDEDLCAVDCQGLRPNGTYLSAGEIDGMTSRTKCFARAKPEDKLEIVKSLQRQGLVSAMTGDGVNDSPALSQSDIGVAMGIQGTEVAKGASDMILTDDNFCSIVKAVEKGRVIYAGIQKFVAFIMSVHIAEVVQIFVCIVAGIPVMRTPLQILFLILVTDLPPSIALGMEPGDSSIIKAQPRPKSEAIVLGWMWCSIIINSVVLSGVIIGVYVFSLAHFCDGKVFQADILDLTDFDVKLAKAQTVAFISLVYSENIRAYSSRSFDGPCWVNFFGNRFMQYAIILAQIALYVAVFVPTLSDTILGLRGLEIGGWGWGVAFAGPVGTIILCEAAKVITHMQVLNYQAKLREERALEEERMRNQIAAHALAKLNNQVVQQLSAEKEEKAQGGAQESGAPSGYAGNAAKTYDNVAPIQAPARDLNQKLIIAI